MLIGLAGKASSGKDTVGKILTLEHGFDKVSFALPIKQALCRLLHVGIHQWDNREWRETVLPIWEQTPRYLAQTLGTEWGRNVVQSNIWLDLAFERVKKFEHVVITDVRFNNEAHRVRDEGGHIIHIIRAQTDGISSPSHSSEASIYILARDFHIDNTGTKESLYEKVRFIVEEVTKDEQVQDHLASTA